MNFDELDAKMRDFETAADQCVLPEVFMVARLDGRSFTRLTKEIARFEAPFDIRFRDMMVATAEALMTCGFHVAYAYSESDEISLLFEADEALFGRKTRKYLSILAGVASARLSLLLGEIAAFDCRISQLPNANLVVDYFRWRNEDSARNALNAHCYWLLRRQGGNEQEATARLSGLSTGEKNELLFQNGVNYNEIPNWQKRGFGLYWEKFDRPGVNPITGETTVARRRQLRKDFDLPMKDDYSRFVRERFAN